MLSLIMIIESEMPCDMSSGFESRVIYSVVVERIFYTEYYGTSVELWLRNLFVHLTLTFLQIMHVYIWGRLGLKLSIASLLPNLDVKENEGSTSCCLDVSLGGEEIMEFDVIMQVGSSRLKV